jgi:hypothetical protein
MTAALLGRLLVLTVLVVPLAGDAQVPKVGEGTVAWYLRQKDPYPGPFMAGVLEALVYVGLRCEKPVTQLAIYDIGLRLREAQRSSELDWEQASLMGSVLLLLAQGDGCTFDGNRQAQMKRAMDLARQQGR